MQSNYVWPPLKFEYEANFFNRMLTMRFGLKLLCAIDQYQHDFKN